MRVEGASIRREEGGLHGKWLVMCFVAIQNGWVGVDHDGHWDYGRWCDGREGMIGIMLARVLGKASEGQAISGLGQGRDRKGKPTVHYSRCFYLCCYLLYKVGCCICAGQLWSYPNWAEVAWHTGVHEAAMKGSGCWISHATRWNLEISESQHCLPAWESF